MPESAQQAATSSPSSRSKKTRPRLRSTTGCMTCRRRHIKCDERKPSCANCGKKSRPCHYEDHDSASPPARVTRAARTRALDKSDEATSILGGDASLSAESANANQQGNLSLDTIGQPAVSYTDDSQEDSAIVDPVDSSSHLGEGVSPFLATLGSILLYADANEHIDVAQLQGNTAPYGSAGQFRELHPETSDTLYTEERAQLVGAEIPIFRNYVDNVSLWVDSFSPDQPFHRLVPNLALRCPVLLHACLALSAKQITLVGLSASYGLEDRDVVYYYRLALNAIRKLLLNPEAARSDEILAACIALSTYEMFDVVGDLLGSHLVGVASLLESGQVNGDSAGIRGACYWTWYRHEIWASIRTGRRLSLDETYWSPPPLDSFDHLEPENIANRVIFLLGQCVSFCNDGDSASAATASEWFRHRSNKIKYLETELEEWKRKLPSFMLCFATQICSAEDMSMGIFGSMSFLFPQSAVANQVYHASRILLHLHRAHTGPMSNGLAGFSFLALRKNLEKHREEIFLTANSNLPNAWTLVACQCLYVAGLVTEGAHERQRTLDLMDQCQRDSGRRTGYLSADLKKLWDSQSNDGMANL